jgi:hypothetical protein
MSEMTTAQEDQAADAMLESQIAEWCHERLGLPVNRPDFEEHPDLDPPTWFDDRDEVVAFARWYFDGYSSVRIKLEIFALFASPWKWNEEYAGYKAENP